MREAAAAFIGVVPLLPDIVGGGGVLRVVGWRLMESSERRIGSERGAGRFCWPPASLGRNTGNTAAWDLSLEALLALQRLLNAW